MKKVFLISFAIVAFLFQANLKAQNNVGIGTNTPHASALLDMTATDKGLLIPRVTLVAAANNVSPVNGPATGLLVYNTGGALVAGFYYWNGSLWVQVGAAGPTCNTLDQGYDCGGSGSGRSITADAGAVAITMPLAATNLEALYVVSNKGSIATPTSVITAENTMPGVAILADASSVTNQYNTIQGSTASNFNSGATGLGAGAVGGFYDGSGNGVGVYGTVTPTNGAGLAGVFGYNARTNGGYGVNGQGYAGVVGEGVLTTLNGFGVFGGTTRGVGVQGETEDVAYQGVVGRNYYTYGATGDGIGVLGDGGTGVWGQTVYGDGYGVYGINGATTSTGNNIGVGGEGWIGVYGLFSNVSGAGGYAVYSDGNFAASGTKAFIIDHPLDPQNKILKHYCIESPVPVNMYRGNAAFDTNGEATVTLPDYFESININFTYQLTPIGGNANLYIKQKIVNGQFVIAGGAPGMEVSWTVYADRNDKYIQAYPESAQTVVDKSETGQYISPELYGQSPEMRLYGHPKTLQTTMTLEGGFGTPRTQKPFSIVR